MNDSYKDILRIIDTSEPALAPEQHTSNLHHPYNHNNAVCDREDTSFLKSRRLRHLTCNIILYRAIVVEGDTALATPFKSSANPNIHRHDASSSHRISLDTSSDTLS